MEDVTSSPWPVRTARLLLRPARVDDADAVWEVRRHEPVFEWTTRAPGTREEHRERFVDPSWLDKSVLIVRDDVVIGDLMLDVVDAWSQAEVADAAKATQANLGWALHPDETGHGYATEAVAALIAVCFEHLGVRRVTADCFAANEASWRLMERVGMRRETHAVADSLHRSGRWLDSYAYGLLAAEWRARRPPAS